MELKLFGKSIFEFKKGKSAAFVYNSLESLEKSAFLPDFHTFRAHNNWDQNVITLTQLEDHINGKKPKKETSKTPELTPKEIHKLKTLHTTFLLKTDEAYIDDQIQQFKDKLNLIKMNEYDVSRGTNEIGSILVRFENRKKYAEFKEFFEEFAYTTTEKINDLIRAHDYLKIDKVDTFLADMPADAIDVMKHYNKETTELCRKKAVFYIIANKKDFEKKDKRRDPILLAQSPFGHFWQILGAWDEEMLLLDEL
jgi:hypothetical protein